MTTLAELEARLLRDPFDNAARVEYARALLAAGRESDALAQYDLARKSNATGPLDEFERLRAPPPPATPREPVKLTVVPGARSAEVVSIARPVAVPDKTRFIHIAGMDDLKKSIRLQIIEPFLNPGLFAKFRKKAGGGILLYGPPGCGKTMLARAVANECNASFLAIGISEILSMWQGESERNLALMFEQRAILRVELAHAVAPLMLGQLTGAAGPGQRGLPVVYAGIEGEQPDAGMNAKWPSLPGEDELLDHFAQGLGLLQGAVVIHFAQQHGELVAADARQFGMAR